MRFRRLVQAVFSVNCKVLSTWQNAQTINISQQPVFRSTIANSKRLNKRLVPSG